MWISAAWKISLAVFLLGMSWKLLAWFSGGLGPKFSLGRRMALAGKGVFSVFTDLERATYTLKSFLLDVLLQGKIWKENKLRWLAHMLVSYGFILLLAVHALGSLFFADYQSTLNPFLFLRGIAGLAAAIGLGIMICRRVFQKETPQLRTSRADALLLVFLGVIFASGFALEAIKISSYSAFKDMVGQYMTNPEPEETKALEAYWAENMGTVIPQKKIFTSEELMVGKIVHENNCLQCHSRPQWSPGSYLLSRAVSPVSGILDKMGAAGFFWYLHYLACLIGLAYLPFSKLFHVFATPISLLINASSGELDDVVNKATTRMIEFDACVGCGACTSECSVAIVSELIPNPGILPSERLPLLKKLASGKLSPEKILRLQQALHICTGCRRCEGMCLAGIDLPTLWTEAKESLYGKGVYSPLILTPGSFSKGARMIRGESVFSKETDEIMEKILSCFPSLLGDNQDPISMDPEHRQEVPREITWGFGDLSSFRNCLTCMTCAGEWPIVREHAPKPVDILGLLPHQVARMLAYGLNDGRFLNDIFRSKMLWACNGCYKCQEVCPQKVPLAEVILRLKAIAIERIEKKDRSR